MEPHVDHAYLAGLVDGEGHIHLPRPRVNGVKSVAYAAIRVTSTDEEVVDWVVGHFPAFRKVLRTRPTSTGKPIFDAIVSNREGLRSVVAAIRPYIQIFRKQGLLDSLSEWIENPPRVGREKQELCARGHLIVTLANGDRRCDECNRRYKLDYYYRANPARPGIGNPGVKRKATCKNGHDRSALPIGANCPECLKIRNTRKK